VGVLIITIITTVLTFTDVIAAKLGMVILLASIAWIFIGMGLYFKFGLFKFWYHDFLEWHTPDDSPMRFDGCSVHARCKHCGREIMQDSQGNWF
jgi:hypothetical protein